MISDMQILLFNPFAVIQRRNNLPFGWFRIFLKNILQTLMKKDVLLTLHHKMTSWFSNVIPVLMLHILLTDYLKIQLSDKNLNLR